MNVHVFGLCSGRQSFVESMSVLADSARMRHVDANAWRQQESRADAVVVMVVLPCLTALCAGRRLWAMCCLFGTALRRGSANQCNNHSLLMHHSGQIGQSCCLHRMPHCGSTC